MSGACFREGREELLILGGVAVIGSELGSMVEWEIASYHSHSLVATGTAYTCVRRLPSFRLDNRVIRLAYGLLLFHFLVILCHVWSLSTAALNFIAHSDYSTGVHYLYDLMDIQFIAVNRDFSLEQCVLVRSDVCTVGDMSPLLRCNNVSLRKFCQNLPIGYI